VPDAQETVNFDLAAGTELRRDDLHSRFGGSGQGGVCPAPRVNSVFLVIAATGRHYGYDYDGWHTDGSLHYTGQGQSGDQVFKGNNGKVLDLARAIHVFEKPRTNYLRYLGRFKLDDAQPYYRGDAVGADGEMRTVIVFKLWPVGEVAEPRGDRRFTATFTKPRVRQVSVEDYKHETFVSNPAAGPTNAERREAKLVQTYRRWLEDQRRSSTRNEISLPDRARPLYTDLFDESAGELIEAKGSASRNHLRLALGQLLDYAQYVDHTRLAVLVPVRPAADLIGLLTKHGISCVFPNEVGSFDRIDSE
jgi:hypothetical protein